MLDFLRLADPGDVRILSYPASSFRIALVRPSAGTGEAFTELHTGLDHLGLRLRPGRSW